MRRRNGFAALHDLASGTRVIVRPKNLERRATLTETLGKSGAAETPAVAATPAGSGKLGPYDLQTSLWRRGDEELLLAHDAALRRRVWIHLQTGEPLAAVRRDLSRPGRLRWLNAGVTPEGRCWNAYAAPNGKPWLALADTPRPWRIVRFWLLDLAEELAAGLNAPATAPCLAVDRLWIDASGRALLLDFPCPDLPAGAALNPPAPLAGAADMQRFLGFVARESLRPDTSQTAPAPPAAQSFLDSLAGAKFEKAEFIVGNLHSLAGRPAEISRAWRVASVVSLPVCFVMLSFLVSWLGFKHDVRWERSWAAAYPGKPSFRAAAPAYLEAVVEKNKGAVPAKDLEAMQAFMANHYGTLVTNDSFWAQHGDAVRLRPAEKMMLRQVAAGHLPPRPDDTGRGAALMLRGMELRTTMTGHIMISFVISTLIYLLLAGVELLGGLIFGSSLLLRLFGLAVVDRRSWPVSRRRLLGRWALSCLPLLLLWLLLCLLCGTLLAAPLDSNLDPLMVANVNGNLLVIIFGVMLVGGILLATAILPRSFHDRLAGTRLVPR